MLVELERPSLKVYCRDREEILQEIFEKYEDIDELINIAHFDKQYFKDLLTALNFSLDPWNNQIFYDPDKHIVWVYDCVNNNMISSDEDILSIITSD